MSSFLSKFKRPGGFQSLLALIESSDSTKRAQMIELIAQEDPGWAHLLKVKALSLEKILQFPVSVLMKLLPELGPSMIVILLKRVNKEEKEKLLISVQSKLLQQVQEEFQKMPDPNDEQFQLASVKLIQLTRSLESRRIIRFEEFDSNLNIEKKLIA